MTPWKQDQTENPKYYFTSK